MPTLQTYLARFQAIQSECAKKILADHGLVCKVGAYKGSVVLKLQKPDWTNDPMHVVPNTTGIFFSIWLTDDSLAQSRILYNIHALKLRLLKHYRISHGGDFAKQFRGLLRPHANDWPNLRTHFGPCTLMQGWATLNRATFDSDTQTLMYHFLPLTSKIDALLGNFHKFSCE